jgi:hypothetical protein
MNTKQKLDYYWNLPESKTLSLEELFNIVDELKEIEKSQKLENNDSIKLTALIIHYKRRKNNLWQEQAKERYENGFK